MYRNDGLVSLYRGVLLNLVASSISQTLFFYIYSDGKKRYNFDAQKPNSWITAWVSLRAGIFSMALTTPMWVVKTRIVLHR
jgi:K+-sensing histidine kinase KdpD